MASGIPPCGTTVQPAENVYTKIPGVPLDLETWSQNISLDHVHKRWTAAFQRLSGLRRGTMPGDEWSGADRQQLVLLMLTTLGDYHPEITEGRFGYSGGVSFSDRNCQQLNLADMIDENTALFIGFADDPGPVNLCVRDSGDDQYDRLSPSQALTMYRVLIPLTNQ